LLSVISARSVVKSSPISIASANAKRALRKS
jgi:hypothetical protein